MTEPMPADYTTAEAEAHMAGWDQAIAAAIRCCETLRTAETAGAARFALDLAIDRLKAIPAPARPSPGRFGILGEH